MNIFKKYQQNKFTYVCWGEKESCNLAGQEWRERWPSKLKETPRQWLDHNNNIRSYLITYDLVWESSICIYKHVVALTFTSIPSFPLLSFHPFCTHESPSAPGGAHSLLYRVKCFSAQLLLHDLSRWKAETQPQSFTSLWKAAMSSLPLSGTKFKFLK